MMEEVEVSKNLRCLLDNHELIGTPEFKSIIMFEGSARSTKTWSVIEYLVNILAQEPLVATCFRYDQVTHNTSTIRDFKEIMMRDEYHGLWKSGKWNSQEKVFTFKGGGILEFRGTKDESKLHGPQRDIAWLNEIFHSYESYRQIATRTSLLTIFDWNPSVSKHWFYDRIMTRPECLYMHSTYKNNPHLSNKQVAEIESLEPTPENKARGTADAYGWSVWGLGLKAKREGAIVKEWFLCRDEEWPEPWNCQRHGYSIDFGFSQDPTVMTENCLFGSRLHCKEIFREKGLITCKSHANPARPSIQGLLEANNISKEAVIVGDCARPEIIAELADVGYNVVACEKGPDSVIAGINLMNSFMIRLHEYSTDLHQDFDQYAWAKKADGTWLDSPDHHGSDGPDSVRYWCMRELARLSGETRAHGGARVARKLRRY